MVSEEEPIDFPVFFPDRIWYVDPVDGTREFIKRNGEFAVMIGLAVSGCARLGVVFRPVTNELFAGIVDQEAWLEKEGGTIPLQVSGEARPSHLRLATSRSRRHRMVDEVRRRLGIREECRIGSVGIKVGLLVTQQADVYLEPTPGRRAELMKQCCRLLQQRSFLSDLECPREMYPVFSRLCNVLSDRRNRQSL